MYILKKLIVKEWYKSFIAAFIVLFLLLSIANLISGFLRGNVTPYEVLMNHFIEIPGYLGKIFPVSCLVASLFSINKLKNRNELTAIFASGYSRKKYILDIFQAAVLVACLQFLTSSYIGPFLKSYRNVLITNSAYKFRNLKSKGLKANTVGSGKIWFKGDYYFFSFLSFNKSKQLINKAKLFYYSNDHLLKKVIKAKTVAFIDNQWIASDVLIINQLSGPSFPQITELKTMPLSIHETTEDFSQIESDITTLNIHKLYQYITKLRDAGIATNEYFVLFLDKFSTSILCLIFTLLASVSVFSPNRRSNSFGKNVVFVFGFTIFYWLIYSYFYELGKNSSINPYLACFTVPAVFSLLLFYYFIKNRKIT